jgi:Na+/H+-translocating membrane pyrophosphatase
MANTHTKKASLSEIIVYLSFVSSIICAIILLATWNKNNATLSYNVSAALCLSSLVYLMSIVGICIMGNGNAFALIVGIAIFGTASYVSYMLCNELQSLKSSPDEVVENEMQNNTELRRLYQIAGWILLSFLIFTFVWEGYLQYRIMSKAIKKGNH